jgi:hypothetical protein
MQRISLSPEFWFLKEKPMNRRDVFKGMLALPVVSALGGCHPDDQHHPSRSGHTLKVILQGPFAVVVPKKGGDEKDHKIRAFVPFDRDSLHEFRFQTPLDPPLDSENSHTPPKTHAFRLSADGLEENERSPYIDHGFDDFKIETGKWEPKLKEYFVFVELPVPDVITFLPPAEGVLFEGGGTGMMPVNQVLEYRVRDMNKVQLHSGGEKYSPLSCSDLYAQYEKYWSQLSAEDQASILSHHPQAKEELTRCSTSDVSAFFFGVGLNRGKASTEEFYKIAGAHALKFFNETLLKSFPNAPNLAKKRLRAIGNYGQPCQPSGQATASPMVMPAVFRSSSLAPRYQTVTSVEDCRAGGLVGLHA